MKNAIREYIELTGQEKSQLWDNAVFVFDTNIFLNLYRYSQETREALFDAMSKLKDRIWMPYHVAYEYMKNREEIIYNALNRYDKIKKEGNVFIDSCAEQFKMKKTDKNIERLKKYISKWIDETMTKYYRSDSYTEDPILNTLLDLFDGKVGNSYDKPNLDKMKKNGKERYEKRIPPGYLDFKKENESGDNNMYGDFIIWNQIMDYAKENNKDIIFITHDQKEDWWYKLHGKTLGPRIEIRKEFIENTNHQFYMYNMETFLKQTNDKNDDKYNQRVIDEVQNFDERAATTEVTSSPALSVFETIATLNNFNKIIDLATEAHDKATSNVNWQYIADLIYNISRVNNQYNKRLSENIISAEETKQEDMKEPPQ